MDTETFTAFVGTTRVAQGPRDALAATLTATLAGPDRGAHPAGLLVFSDRTGAPVDLDLSGRAPGRAGTETAPRTAPALRPDGTPRRGPGRPKLGVTAREVTLLPRHWDWLAAQRGGASASLRRLVEAAMRSAPVAPAGRDAAYAFLTAIGGDRPGYETAIRALYAEGGRGFAAALDGWPEDLRAHACALAGL